MVQYLGVLIYVTQQTGMTTLLAESVIIVGTVIYTEAAGINAKRGTSFTPVDMAIKYA